MSENTTPSAVTEVTEENEIEIAEFFTDTMSPYGMMKSVNKILKALGVEKELPGPMFYTYTKKGYITTIEGTDKKRIAKADAIEWTVAYVEKLITKAAKVETKPVNEVQEALDALNESDEA